MVLAQHLSIPEEVVGGKSGYGREITHSHEGKTLLTTVLARKRCLSG